MQIEVDVVPPSLVPRGQLDDYQSCGVGRTGVRFTIADTGNDLYTRLLLIHAIIEETLTSAAGVSYAEIDKYDEDHPHSPEPGDEPDCPYRDQHSIAVAVERILCAKLGISWEEFDNHIRDHV